MFIGTAIGLFGSILTNGLEIWKRKQDNEHELNMLKENREQFKLEREYNLKTLDLQADIQQFQTVHDHDTALMKRASRKIVNLSASIRPVTTYWFFALFASIKTIPILYAVLDAVLIFGLYKTQTGTLTAMMTSMETFMRHLPAIWDPATAELFAAIMSYWFGDRSMKKWMGRS